METYRSYCDRASSIKRYTSDSSAVSCGIISPVADFAPEVGIRRDISLGRGLVNGQLAPGLISQPFTEWPMKAGDYSWPSGTPFAVLDGFPFARAVV